MTKPNHEDDRWLHDIVGFLRTVGIDALEGTVPENSFLPGVYLDHGSLVYDRTTLKYPGDLLHEAGHWALTDPARRVRLDGHVVNDEGEDDGAETAVLLWSWLAAQHAGIPPEVVFHPGGFKGDHEWLIEQYSNQTYVGLPLLHWMGIVNVEDDGRLVLVKWLRD